MTVHLTEAEFQGLGLTIDPTDPSRAVLITAQSDSLPDDSWDLDRLARYASTGLAEAARLEHESIQIGRRSTVQVFRSGRALSIARRRLKSEGRGRWGNWQEQHGFSRTTVWEAIELFERAGSEEEVARLTPGGAKAFYGITKRSSEVFDEPESSGTPDQRNTAGPIESRSPASTGVPPDETENQAGIGERAGGGGAEITRFEDLPPMQGISAHDLLETLVKIVNVLKYLEGDVGSVDLRGLEPGDFLMRIDEGIEAYTRIRERITSHAV